MQNKPRSTQKVAPMPQEITNGPTKDDEKSEWKEQLDSLRDVVLKEKKDENWETKVVQGFQMLEAAVENQLNIRHTGKREETPCTKEKLHQLLLCEKTEFARPDYMEQVTWQESFQFDPESDKMSAISHRDNGGPWVAALSRSGDDRLFTLSCTDVSVVDIFSKDGNNIITFSYLLSSDNRKEPFRKIDSKKWAKITDKQSGYRNKDGKIAVGSRTAYWRRAKSQFDRPYVSRFAVVVEGKKIYVSRDLLAMHSNYFYNLFYGNNPTYEQEVVLKNVKHDDFVEFLRVLSPENKEITETNVKMLLDYSFRYVMPYLREHCRLFIENNKRADLVRLIELCPPSQFIDDYSSSHWANIAENSPYSVIIDGKRMGVSRAMLALHSPVFHALFFQDFVDKTRTEVTLKGVTFEKFSEFYDVLACAYDKKERVNEKTVVSLLQLADMYCVPFVAKACATYLYQSYKSQHNVDNALYIFALVDQYALTFLLMACLKYGLPDGFKKDDDGWMKGRVSESIKNIIRQEYAA